MRIRRGFILHTVLWTIVVASTLALSAELGGRDGIDASRNRMNAERAAWRAQGCASEMLALLDERLRRTTDASEQARVWIGLAAEVEALAPALEEDCVATLHPTGTRLDMNSASEESIRGLLGAVGVGSASSEILESLRLRKRLGPLQAREELGSLRGLDRFPAVVELLDVRDGPVNFWHASPAVLATVPGFNPQVIQSVLRIRERGRLVLDLREVADGLAREDIAEFAEHFSESSRRITLLPVGWDLRARVAVGSPTIERTEEWALRRTEGRLVMVGRRVW